MVPAAVALLAALAELNDWHNGAAVAGAMRTLLVKTPPGGRSGGDGGGDSWTLMSQELVCSTLGSLALLGASSVCVCVRACVRA